MKHKFRKAQKPETNNVYINVVVFYLFLTVKQPVCLCLFLIDK